MSEIINGKEALIALANDQCVEYMDTSDTFKSLGWCNAFGLGTNLFFSDRFKFRFKPRHILINGVEVPAPFKPKEDCQVWIIDDGKIDNYTQYNYEFDGDEIDIFIGMWRTEDEIKKVVSALRSIFKGEVK